MVSGSLIPGLMGKYAHLPEAAIPPPPEWLALYLHGMFRARLGAFMAQHRVNYRFTSGYRTAAKNEAVGGASNSAHMHGLAGDVVPAQGADWQRIAAEWREDGGFALVEPDHLHLAMPRAWGWKVIRWLGLAAALALVLGIIIISEATSGRRQRKA